MPRVRFESGADDDDFDLPAGHERTRNPKVWRAKAIGSPTRKQRKLTAAKRALVAGQRQVFVPALAKISASSDPSILGFKPNRLRATILTSAQAQAIFEAHFAPGNDRLAATADFNHTVRSYIAQASRERPTIAAGLGELGIFGVIHPSQAGQRHIGIRLTGEGAEALVSENNGLLAALNAAELCSGPIDQRFYSHTLHADLATTYSHPAAEALKTTLRDARTVEMMRAQLKTEANPEGLVAFGRALPDY
jgi:hypothetical protein